MVKRSMIGHLLSCLKITGVNGQDSEREVGCVLRILLLARLAQGFQDLFMNVYPDHPSSRATFFCLDLIWELA